MDTSKQTPNVELHGCGDATALHAATDAGLNLVSFGNLRVMITSDGSHWTAQGLEIDYAVDGNDIEAVKQSFAEGLYRTAHEHIRLFGNLRRLLRLAPIEVWSAFFECAEAGKFTHHQISIQNHKVDFYEQKAA